MNDRPSIPAIITTDTSSTHDYDDRDQDLLSLSPESAMFPLTPATNPTLTVPGFVVSHSRSSSGGSGDYLSPTQSPYLKPSARSSLEVPGSPSSFGGHSPSLYNRSSSPFGGSSSPTYASSHEGLSAPPSPTLSNRSSVHFATSVALRDNKPDEHSGLTSLNLLDTNFGLERGHRRKNSWASTTEDGIEPTEPDHGGINILSPTTTHIATSSSSSRSRSNASRQDGRSRKGKGRASSGDDAESDDRTFGDATVVLQPDPSKDTTDPAPFEFKPMLLASLLDPKNLRLLDQMGGVEGLVIGLGTDAVRGLSRAALVKTVSGQRVSGQRHDRDASGAKATKSIVNDAYGAMLEIRHKVYGQNILPVRKSKTLLQLMWLALKDTVLVLLSIAAVVSFGLGLFQDFGTPRPPGEPPVKWVEGVAIMVAVVVVVAVGSVNDWQKERQFKNLNDRKEERGVKVIRDGVEHVVDVKEVVVGDIALLEPGEIIPCDGVFLRGHNVKCDESVATGETDTIKKMPFSDCLAALERDGRELEHVDCFLVSGSKVLEGVGSYLVIAVGTKSYNGRIMMALRGDNENTPLQLKLNALAELIAKLGSAAGLILFTALMIRFFVELGTHNPPRNANLNGMQFVQILIIAVTLVVVAVPEGLPLAVTLALAFATKRMTRENLLVRVLGSCETMANASVICTDKTGTLTQNMMTVVAGSIGIHAKFVQHLEQNQARTNADDTENHEPEMSEQEHGSDFSIDQAQINEVASPQLCALFNDAIAVNSTAFEDTNADTGLKEFVGSKTETALLTFAQDMQWEDYKTAREAANVVQMIPFSSERKAMGVVVKVHERKYRLYLKGASEILTKKCTRHVVVRPREKANERVMYEGDDEDEVEVDDIDEYARENVSRTIIFYANQTLRTIALCYREFDSWPPRGSRTTSEDEVDYEFLARNLTLIAITGIEDPLREGVREAVADCHRAGVTVKMCTGDNVLTARSIAAQCGIYTSGGIIMEGPAFRALPEKEMLEVVPRLQVLARSSPEDKKLLVEKLKALGEVVGVTGDGTNDGPALKTAHVGFSMGIAGTEVAKEASDIILMDDNFSSIVKAIMWGRCVNDAVRKFLQFQISVNVTAVIVTMVSAIASNQQTSVLTAVQLLWINIIMDTFAALALATDKASPSLLDRQPDKKSAPLFSVDMYKQIIGQSLYTTAMTLLFNYAGQKILGLPASDGITNSQSGTPLSTLIFNAFVFSQIFNSINCRRIDNKLNVFEGVTRNFYFISITCIEIAVQVFLCFKGGAAFSVVPMNGMEWGVSLALGFLSLPIGLLIRLIPNPPVERLFIKLRLLPDPNALPTVRPDSNEWNSAIDLVRDNLNTFAHLRGGRLRSSSFVHKSRSARLAESHVGLPSLLAMVPTLVATSVGAGWAPQPQSGSLSDPARNDPSRSSAALWEGRIQVHPDTQRDDPTYQKYGPSQEGV